MAVEKCVFALEYTRQTKARKFEKDLNNITHLSIEKMIETVTDGSECDVCVVGTVNA